MSPNQITNIVLALITLIKLYGIFFFNSDESRYPGLVARAYVSVNLSKLVVSKQFFNRYEVRSLEECGAHCNLMRTPYKCEMFVFENGTQSFCNFGGEEYVNGGLPFVVGNWTLVYTQSGEVMQQR